MPTLHERRFPNESDTYRKTRNELLAAERDLRDPKGGVRTDIPRSTTEERGCVDP